MSETMLTEQAATTTEGEQTAATTETEQSASPGQAQEGQQQEQQQEEAKPEGAPEKYELKPQEGQEFDGEFLKAYEDVARELNMSNEAAQKILDKVAPVIQQRQMARIEAVRNEWAEAAKVDKEFGGDKLNENLAIAKQGVEKFATPELKEMLNQTGLGNNPEVVRLFYRVGKAISEDTFVGGQQSGKAQPKTFNDYAEKLYG